MFGTVKIIEGLVRRGLVEVVEEFNDLGSAIKKETLV
jgi:hypothetical protein